MCLFGCILLFFFRDDRKRLNYDCGIPVAPSDSSWIVPEDSVNDVLLGLNSE
jgi:hypothetical protein